MFSALWDVVVVVVAGCSVVTCGGIHKLAMNSIVEPTDGVVGAGVVKWVVSY